MFEQKSRIAQGELWCLPSTLHPPPSTLHSRTRASTRAATLRSQNITPTPASGASAVIVENSAYRQRFIMAAVATPTDDDEDEDEGGAGEANQTPVNVPVVMLAKEHGEMVRMVQSRVDRLNEQASRGGGSGGGGSVDAAAGDDGSGDSEGEGEGEGEGGGGAEGEEGVSSGAQDAMSMSIKVSVQKKAYTPPAVGAGEEADWPSVKVCVI